MDGTDRTILAALADDGRIPFAELGARVGLSASAAKRRVDRMRAQGLIAGFTVLLGGEALAWRTQAIVEVFCDGKTAPSSIRGAMISHPEVVSAYTVTGDADALLVVWARDTTHLEEAIERIRRERFVLRTRTTLVLSRLVDRPAPLD